MGTVTDALKQDLDELTGKAVESLNRTADDRDPNKTLWYETWSWPLHISGHRRAPGAQGGCAIIEEELSK
jgi:hypothetical protein